MAEIREFGGGFHIGEKDKIPTIPGVGMEGEAGFNFKCFLFLPERYKEGELTVILPGFGHRASALGDSFKRSAEFFAETSKVPTIIPLEDWQPNHKDLNRRYTYWTLAGFGRRIAVAKCIDLLDNKTADERRQKLKQLMGVQGDIPGLNIERINFIGYSYHGPTAVELGADYLPKTRAVICVAPINNRYELRESADEKKLPIVSGEPEYAFLFGNRGLPLIDPLAIPSEGEKRDEKQSLQENAKLLKVAGIPIRILYGSGDPVMPIERSRDFTRLIESEMTVVYPIEAIGARIHDFSDEVMMKTIADALLI